MDGDGVVGFYPILSSDMQEPFVYESCCPVRELGSSISGWFEFRYTEGPQTGETFKANIDPFILNLDPGTHIVDNVFFEQWMHF